MAVAAVLLLGACAAGGDGAGPAGGAATTVATAGATGSSAPTGTALVPIDDQERDDMVDPSELTDEELAAETYVAGYPMVVSIRTMQRLGGLLGINPLFWQSSLSGPESRVIVAPNRDTLYSIAVLDLRAGPLVLTLPEVTDRYFTYQFLSPWTDSLRVRRHAGHRRSGRVVGARRRRAGRARCPPAPRSSSRPRPRCSCSAASWWTTTPTWPTCWPSATARR